MSRIAPSIDEVHEAFYVDYEAWQDGPPVILGVLRVEDGVALSRQEVVHEDFRPAASAKGLLYSTPRDAIERLVTQVEAAQVAVISWSQHELEDLFVPYGSTRAVEILSAAYRTGIPLAKAWRRRCAPDWLPSNNNLAAYMAKTGYPVPSAFGPNQTGQRLRAVHRMLIARGNDYGALTPVAKAKWAKVLGHNHHDCHGMRHVCLAAAASSPRERDQIADPLEKDRLPSTRA